MTTTTTPSAIQTGAMLKTPSKMLQRILIYKRTHNGDPDANGCFGIHDCMGSFRARDFDAVIGIGGVGAKARANGIAGKINWIGVGPHKVAVGKRGPEVTFDHFLDYGTHGSEFRMLAPHLAERIYRDNVRVLLHGFTPEELAEANEIVRRARTSRCSKRHSYLRRNAEQSDTSESACRTKRCK